MSTRSTTVLPPIQSIFAMLPDDDQDKYYEGTHNNDHFSSYRRQPSVCSSNTSDDGSDSPYIRTPSLSPPPSPGIGNCSANSSFSTAFSPRTPSPPPIRECTQRRRIRSRAEVHPQSAPLKFVRSRFQDADALLFVPPELPSNQTPHMRSDVPSISRYAREQRHRHSLPVTPVEREEDDTSLLYPKSEQPQPQRSFKAFLIRGPRLAFLRTPAGTHVLKEYMDKGARFYPYHSVRCSSSSATHSSPNRKSAPATRLSSKAK